MLAALEHGKHVFSEKPLAMTAEEGWQLVHLAKENGKEAGVNFCYRYYPALLEAKHQFKEKTLGKIDKIIVDKNAGSGIVPYLPLPELQKKNKINQTINNDE